MSSAVASLRGVHKGFGGREILSGVDLDLHPGRITVVVGPSGGGKSVLLDLLLGLLTPDTGAVSRPTTVGMVFQDSALFDDLSVAENLAFPARALPAAEQAARVEVAARAVGLAPGHLAARPSQLSGGLRKRAAIARALVQAPPVVLYDEPTSGLDAASSARIATAILAARDASDTPQAALVVTHDYPLAARVADEVLYLDPTAHRLVPLMDAAALDTFGPRADAISAIRDALEAHFAAEDPPPSEPGTHRDDLLTRLGAAALDRLDAFSALTRVRVPGVGPLTQRVWELGVTSAPAIMVSGLVLGLVTALQLGQALNLTLGDLDPLPALLGVVIAHHVGPLYTGLFLAGRVGARIASEVGVKTYLRQADALETFGTSAEAVWLSPMLWAALLSFPALAVLLEAMGVVGGYVGYVLVLGQNTAGFHSTVLSEIVAGPMLLGLLKATTTGGVVALVAYHAGRGARRGSDAVGRATTRAVVSGLLGAIVVELVFSVLGGSL